MTIAPDAAPALADLRVGDGVVLKRSLDHPAWARQDVDEVISARTSVMDRREVPAIPGPAGFGGREARTLVRLPNGLWYDCATGLQHGCGATVIELPTERPVNATAVSDAIAASWGLVTSGPPHDAAHAATTAIIDRLPPDPELSRSVRGALSDWWIANAARIDDWLREVRLESITEEQFFHRLQDSLLAIRA